MIIDVADTDAFLYGLPVADLVEKLFDLSGFSTKLSSGGLIARQLITQLGGLQGARAFKIPGVRRLLRRYGPTDSFTKKGALDLIGSKDPANPKARFKDHEDLHIEFRSSGTKLKPTDVFSHLVEKRLFRLGVKLTCPTCRLGSWTALDQLRQQMVCELCAQEYDATRQLVNGEWRYRRSGVLGTERNAQGAIPLVLTLQQLDINIRPSMFEDYYSPSIDLKAKEGVDNPNCEVDLVWVINRPYPSKVVVIVGECKDRGPIKLSEFEKDIDNLRRVANAFPRRRFETFVLLTKLSPFTPEEIQCAKTLNDEYRHRAILLTDRELEPYHIFERVEAEFGITVSGGAPQGLSRSNDQNVFPGKASPYGVGPN